jgi:hypothetical protein
MGLGALGSGPAFGNNRLDMGGSNKMDVDSDYLGRGDEKSPIPLGGVSRLKLFVAHLSSHYVTL